MARKKPEPVLTHTALLCLAARALEQDIQHWEKAYSYSPDGAKRMAEVCARQIKQLDVIRQLYLIETGVEM